MRLSPLALVLLLPACIHVVPGPPPDGAPVPTSVATPAPTPAEPVAVAEPVRVAPAPRAPRPAVRPALRPATAEPRPAGPRARLALGIAQARRSGADERLDVTVVLGNDGPEAVYVLPPDLRWLEPTVTLGGRRIGCRIVSTQQQPTPRDFVRLGPGRELARTVDLSRYCELGRPGTYRIAVRYRVGSGAAEVLPPREQSRVWTGALTSEGSTFYRERRAARADIRLEARPAEPVFHAGGPLRVSVSAENLGPDAVGLPEPAPADLSVELRDAAGRRRRCEAGRAAAADATVRPVPAGGRVASVVDLAELCGPLPAGRWQASLTWRPATRVRPVRAVRRAVPAWTGTATAPSLDFTVRGAGGPPAAPSPAAPRLTLSAPPKVRAGDALPITLRLEAPSGGTTLLGPEPWMVRLSVQDRRGRPVRCADDPPPRTRVRRRDFVHLNPGEAVTLEVDAAAACDLDEKGRYRVAAELRIPPRFDGRPQRLEAWTGRVEAPAVTVRVQQARPR